MSVEKYQDNISPICVILSHSPFSFLQRVLADFILPILHLNVVRKIGPAFYESKYNQSLCSYRNTHHQHTCALSLCTPFSPN